MRRGAGQSEHVLHDAWWRTRYDWLFPRRVVEAPRRIKCHIMSRTANHTPAFDFAIPGPAGCAPARPSSRLRFRGEIELAGEPGKGSGGAGSGADFSEGNFYSPREFPRGTGLCETLAPAVRVLA
jgi:hypothetical protein